MLKEKERQFTYEFSLWRKSDLKANSKRNKFMCTQWDSQRYQQSRYVTSSAPLSCIVYVIRMVFITVSCCIYEHCEAGTTPCKKVFGTLCNSNSRGTWWRSEPRYFKMLLPVFFVTRCVGHSERARRTRRGRGSGAALSPLARLASGAWQTMRRASIAAGFRSSRRCSSSNYNSTCQGSISNLHFLIVLWVIEN